MLFCLLCTYDYLPQILLIFYQLFLPQLISVLCMLFVPQYCFIKIAPEIPIIWNCHTGFLIRKPGKEWRRVSFHMEGWNKYYVIFFRAMGINWIRLVIFRF